MSTITDPDDVGDSSSGDETRASSPSSFVSSIPSSFAFSIQFIGFWGAVVLPFLYVPLVISGLDTAGQRQTFIFLVGLNIVALVFGHHYRERA